MSLHDTDPDKTAPAETLAVPAGLVAQMLADRYLFVGPLGRGGMGEVWRAYDSKLHREVAMKLVRAEDTSGASRDRLLREARALARLSHPNVVAVYDAGDAGDHLFVAMELVEGQTLAAWRRTKPSPSALLDVFLAAGAGLVAAHRKGILHGDFKPENVMIDREGRVKVLDFGLARFVAPLDGAAPSAVATSVDATGPRAGASGGSAELARTPPDGSTPTTAAPEPVKSALKGTPRYMAPEQWLGHAGDARTDQYAFSVALYESLHGHHPVLSDDEGKTAAPYRVPRGLPRAEAIGRALQRALAADPADRFPSMDELLRALRPRSRAVWSVPLVAAAGALVVGFGFARVLHRADPCEAAGSLAGVWDPDRRAAIAARFSDNGGPKDALLPRFDGRVQAYVDRWSTMRREACLATRVRGVQSERLMDLRMACLERRRNELHGFLGQVEGVRTAPELAKSVDAVSALTPVDICADGEALGRVELPEAPAQRAAAALLATQLDEMKGRLNVVRGDLKEAEARPLLEEARRIGYAPLIAEALLIMGSAESEAGHYRESVASLEEAAQKAAEAKNDDYLARAWVKLLDPVTSLEDRERFFALEPVARAAIVRKGGDARLANMLDRIAAWEFLELGRFEEARQRFAQAAAVAHGDPNLRDREGAALDGLGSTLKMLGRYSEAEQTLREALAILEEAVGPHHPRVATSLNNLAEILATLGTYDEAEALFRRSAEIADAYLAPNHPDRGLAPYNLAVMLRMRGRFTEARAFVVHARERFVAAYGPSNLSVAMCIEEMAKISLQEGHFADALATFREALAAYEADVGPDSWQAGSAHEGVATTLVTMGRAPEAEPHARRALAIASKTASEPVRHANAELCAARVYGELPGKRAEALAYAHTALDRLAPLAPSFEHERNDIAAWLAAHERR